MIIKKFTANTETEAMMLAMEELGKDAIVMNKKVITPRGFYRLFRKPRIEITAAVDEGLTTQAKQSKERARAVLSEAARGRTNAEQERYAEIRQETATQNASALYGDPAQMEQKLMANLQSMLEKQIGEISVKKEAEQENQEKPEKEEEPSKSISCLSLVYQQLIENEVDEQFANQLVNEIEQNLKKDIAVDSILSSIYQKIILKLGQVKLIEPEEGKTKFFFFIGPTGVGKTTTIAKVASSLKVGKQKKIALLTADTYRIAAVEQLRIYANILDIPMTVIYTEEEMAEAYQAFQEYDLVLVDTAGRSHRSKEQRDDLERLIGKIPKEQREVYLVLSVTTKYSDLIRIAEAYSEVLEYSIIFTKLDETAKLGNIYNIKQLTGAPLSYVTFGQSVPDDINRLNAQLVAKQLLGGNE